MKTKEETAKIRAWARILLRHNKPLLKAVRKTAGWDGYLRLLRSVRGTDQEGTVWGLLAWRRHAADLEDLLRSQNERLLRR